MNELEVAEIQRRLSGLGLDSGVSSVSKARMSRVTEKVEKLKTLITPEQWMLLANLLQLHKGDLEEKIDALLAAAELGGFQQIVDQEPPRQADVRPLANRAQRRRKRRDRVS